MAISSARSSSAWPADGSHLLFVEPIVVNACARSSSSPKLLGQSECLACDSQGLVEVAVQEAKPRGEAQHASPPHGGTSSLEQLVGAIEMRLSGIALAGEPRHAREVCLRLGSSLVVAVGD